MNKLFFLGTLIACLYVFHSLAEENKKLSIDSAKESDREQMALAHEDMAKCLRSGKGADNCMMEMQSRKISAMNFCNMDHTRKRRMGAPKPADK